MHFVKGSIPDWKSSVTSILTEFTDLSELKQMKQGWIWRYFLIFGLTLLGCIWVADIYCIQLCSNSCLWKPNKTKFCSFILQTFRYCVHFHPHLYALLQKWPDSVDEALHTKGSHCCDDCQHKVSFWWLVHVGPVPAGKSAQQNNSLPLLSQLKRPAGALQYRFYLMFTRFLVFQSLSCLLQLHFRSWCFRKAKMKARSYFRPCFVDIYGLPFQIPDQIWRNILLRSSAKFEMPENSSLSLTKSTQGQLESEVLRQVWCSQEQKSKSDASHDLDLIGPHQKQCRNCANVFNVS